jgi:hypothetical protein
MKSDRWSSGLNLNKVIHLKHRMLDRLFPPLRLARFAARAPTLSDPHHR